MGAQQIERQVREQVEERAGRPLSDEEWETFKLALQRQAADAESSTLTTGAARQWTGKNTALCLAGTLALLAAVGMFLRPASCSPRSSASRWASSCGSSR